MIKKKPTQKEKQEHKDFLSGVIVVVLMIITSGFIGFSAGQSQGDPESSLDAQEPFATEGLVIHSDISRVSGSTGKDVEISLIDSDTTAIFTCVDDGQFSVTFNVVSGGRITPVEMLLAVRGETSPAPKPEPDPEPKPEPEPENEMGRYAWSITKEMPESERQKAAEALEAATAQLAGVPETTLWELRDTASRGIVQTIVPGIPKTKEELRKATEWKEVAVKINQKSSELAGKEPSAEEQASFYTDAAKAMRQ